MNKYITPTIEIEKLNAEDIMVASGFSIARLVGVDNEGESSAIINVSQFF